MSCGDLHDGIGTSGCFEFAEVGHYPLATQDDLADYP